MNSDNLLWLFCYLLSPVISYNCSSVGRAEAALGAYDSVVKRSSDTELIRGTVTLGQLECSSGAVLELLLGANSSDADRKDLDPSPCGHALQAIRDFNFKACGSEPLQTELLIYRRLAVYLFCLWRG